MSKKIDAYLLVVHKCVDTNKAPTNEILQDILRPLREYETTTVTFEIAFSGKSHEKEVDKFFRFKLLIDDGRKAIRHLQINIYCGLKANEGIRTFSSNRKLKQDDKFTQLTNYFVEH
ncbi:CLUMA_CG021476, isoform A [Clunio marinus]|uniref:CLUMA_CG021476, isoform A n=1 Tax=Clunio marinus TaxID=568069 RepID=A0A1J1J7M7_9DIPT|nr:CLUMA_CG021476, isoform A [Clunio marinus]